MAGLGRPQAGGSALGGPVAARVYLVETDLAATPARPFRLKLSTRSYTSAADDPDRPNEHWDGRVTNPGSLSRAASLTSVGEAAVQSSSGMITIANTDGRYDELLDDAVTEELLIRVGQPTSRWEDFITLHRMRVTGITMDHDEVRLDVEDPTSYTVAPYPVTYYAGTGGIEGDAELAGVMRQVIFGWGYNVPVQLIDRARLIYQVHDGPVAFIDSVRDMGVGLTDIGFEEFLEFPTYAALAAATIPAGHFAVSKELGLFRLGDEPAGVLTADVRGHAPAGTTTNSIANWLVRQVQARVGIDFDGGLFDNLPPWSAGWVWSEPFSYQDALSRFVGDAGFVWGTTPRGLLACAKLEEPDWDHPDTVFIAKEDIVGRGVERVSLPPGYESTHGTRTVRHQRAWVVLGENDLAGSVATRADAQRRQNEWRSVVAKSSETVRNPMEPPTLDTSLRTATQAQQLANHLIALHGRRRNLFSVTAKTMGSLPPIYGTVVLRYPRFGLRPGKALRIVSIQQDFAAGTSTYLLWG